MVTVNMAQKTCERVVLPLDLSKVINLYEVSNAVATAFETNFECQGTLGVREPVRLKDDGLLVPSTTPLNVDMLPYLNRSKL